MSGMISLPTVARLRDIILGRIVGSPGMAGADTRTNGFFYNLANGIAETARSLLVRAQGMQEQMVPTEATGTYLRKWADCVLADPPYDPTQWEGTITFRSAAGGINIPVGTECVASDGTAYETTVLGVTWVNTPPWWYCTTQAQAVLGGTVANKEDGTELTVTSPPVGVSDLATIAATTTAGTNAETEAEIHRRIATWLQDRPGGGNCSDFRAWAREVENVYEAYVYPVWNGPNTVHIVITGDPAVSRILTAADQAACQAAINAVCPLFATPLVLLPQLQLQQVQITVRYEPGYGPDWDIAAYAPTVVASVAATRRIDVTGLPVAVGNWTAGMRIVTHNADDTTHQHTIESVTDVGPNGYVIVREAWPDSPAADPLVGSAVYDGGPLWQFVKDAVKSAFDGVGCSIGIGGDPLRWPLATAEQPSTLYMSDIYEAVEAIPGVISSNLVAPAANVANVIAAAGNPSLTVNLGAGGVADIVITWAPSA